MLLFLAMIPVGYAQEKLSVYGEVGYLIPADHDVRNKYGSGILPAIGLEYSFSPEWSSGLSVSYWKGNKDEAIHDGQVKNSLRTIPLIFYGTYNFQLQGKIKPYAGGGLGVYFAENTANGSYMDTLMYHQVTISEQDFKTAFGLNLFAGVTFPVSDRISLIMEGRYSYAKAPDWNMNLGGYSLSIGIKFFPFEKAPPIMAIIIFNPPAGTSYPTPYPDPNWDKTKADSNFKKFLKWLNLVADPTSPVMADINAEIKEWEKKSGKTAEAVEISADFMPKSQLMNDIKKDISAANGYELKDQQNILTGAQNATGGYTYTYYDSAKKKQVIKIVIFSDAVGERLDSFPWDNEDRGIVRLIIHEFIHAKLYALGIAGAADSELPFPDVHGGKFDEKEKQLFDKFVEWAKKNKKDK